MLQVRDVSVRFGTLQVLRGIDLDVAQGEILCLLGPSGCGKTTLLRVIAGLEQVERGDVLFGGQSIVDVPVHQRDFGLMFQDFALFPHMDVAGNVAFGLRMRGVARTEQRQRIDEALQLVGLSGFERRDVTQLSGGERQRVALARSLAPNPRLLMLDEPLGSLDAALKARLVIELREIIKRVGLTAIYVTHDQEEAYAIADRVAVMNRGLIEQIDAPPVLYRHPKTTFVATFLGLNNVLPVLSQTGNRAFTAVSEFNVNGQPKAVLLHPDGITLAGKDVSNTIKGRVVECIFAGDVYRLKVLHESGAELSFKLSARESSLNVGDEVQLQIAPEWVIELEG